MLDSRRARFVALIAFMIPISLGTYASAAPDFGFKTPSFAFVSPYISGVAVQVPEVLPATLKITSVSEPLIFQSLLPLAIRRVEPVTPLEIPKLAVAPVPARLVPVALAPAATYTAPKLVSVERPQLELKVNYWHGKPPTIPTGNFYQGEHPFDRMVWPWESVPGGITISSGTLSVVVGGSLNYSESDVISAAELYVSGVINQPVDLPIINLTHQANSVPEPASLAIACAAAICGLMARRRSVS